MVWNISPIPPPPPPGVIPPPPPAPENDEVVYPIERIIMKIILIITFAAASYLCFRFGQIGRELYEENTARQIYESESP